MSPSPMSRGTIPSGTADTATQQRRGSRPPALLRFWRWLTCGHGHHRWQLHAALDLATMPPMCEAVFWLSHNAVGNGAPVVIAKHCPRCDLIEIVE